MATTYEVVQALHQAAANAYDGSEAKVGLKREEGDPILDSRIIDGFKVKISGDILKVMYHTEASMKEYHGNDLEDDCNAMLKEIVSFLKKEYKSITGNALTLTAMDEEADMLVTPMSRIRTFVQACKRFKIGGLDKDLTPVGQSSEDAWKELTKTALKEGKHNALKARNINWKNG